MKRLAVLALILAARIVSAQDGPAVDPKSMLILLKDLKMKHAEAIKSQSRKVIQELSAATASPGAAIGLYTEAKKATTFAGRDHAQALFIEWKEGKRGKDGRALGESWEQLKSPDMQNAVLFHLRYLVLSLQRAGGMTLPQILPDLIRFAEQLALPDNSTVRHHELLKRSIHESIFVKWYGIDHSLAGLVNADEGEDWEMVPGNVDSIWQKTILPYFRANKDPRLITYWDRKIKEEVAAMSDAEKAFDVDQFNNVVKPNLLWMRAEDMMAIGLRNRGLTEMFAIMKGWPDHPEAARRISKLETVLTGTAAAPAK